MSPEPILYLVRGSTNTLSSRVLCVTQARYRKEQASAQPPPWIPPVDNLLKDSTDGSALAALLHFYCPQLLQLSGKQPCSCSGAAAGVPGGFLEQEARKHSECVCV